MKEWKSIPVTALEHLHADRHAVITTGTYKMTYAVILALGKSEETSGITSHANTSRNTKSMLYRTTTCHQDLTLYR